MASGGLEDWRNLMQDDSLHIVIAKIVSLHPADDRSYIKVKVETFPDGQIIVSRMSWEGVGPNAGIFMPPVAGDMVLVAFAEGDNDQAFVIKRLTSKEDNYPINVDAGDTVIKALSGKNLWISSDTKINLAAGDAAPTENVVLGQIFKQFAADLLGEIATLIDNMKLETHLGALPGMPTGVPINAAAYEATKTVTNALKSSPINDEAVLSNISYTD